MAHVLIAERTQPLRRLIRTIVERAGHTADAVASAGEVLRRLGASRYDCVVFGAPLLIEGRERKTLLQHFVESGRRELPPLIVLTARTLDRDLLCNAVQLRVCAVFSEPFDHDDLLNAIESCARNGRPPRRFVGFGETTLRYVFGDDLTVTEW